jgi:hypothetical protein
MLGTSIQVRAGVRLLQILDIILERVHGEFQNAEEIGDSCTGEHLRDMRAQCATLTVRIAQTDRLEVGERIVGQLILECAVAAGSKFVVTGDEHGAGRSDALIEESQNRAAKLRMDVGARRESTRRERAQIDGRKAAQTPAAKGGARWSLMRRSSSPSDRLPFTAV